MLLPPLLARPRELPGAWAPAENADKSITPIIKTKSDNLFALMTDLLSFLITFPVYGYEDL